MAIKAMQKENTKVGDCWFQRREEFFLFGWLSSRSKRREKRDNVRLFLWLSREVKGRVGFSSGGKEERRGGESKGCLRLAPVLKGQAQKKKRNGKRVLGGGFLVSKVEFMFFFREKNKELCFF